MAAGIPLLMIRYNILLSHVSICVVAASFTCLSGVKAFSMGSLITDRSEEESCDARDGVAPKCYQITIELTMTMDGEDCKLWPQICKKEVYHLKNTKIYFLQYLSI